MLTIGSSQVSVAQPARAGRTLSITGPAGQPMQSRGAAPVRKATQEDGYRVAEEQKNFSYSEDADPRFKQAIESLKNRPRDKPLTASQIPPFLLALCKIDPRAENPRGHVFHREFWCQRWTQETTAAVDGKPVGGAKLKYIAVALADDRSNRRVDIMLQPTEADSWGVVKDLPSSTMGIGPECDGHSCTVFPTGWVERTVPNWQLDARQGAWYGWQISDDENKGSFPDKVLYHLWHFFGGARVPTYPPSDAKGEDSLLRCDSAQYFRNEPRGCINADVISYITYQLGLPPEIGSPEVAAHIRDALDRPDTTFPPRPHHKNIPGKYIPGSQSGGLHRISEVESQANREVVAQNCKLLPGPGSDRDCDEYAFAITLEGAANPNFDFSVRYVNKNQNRRAGSYLRWFLSNDRILYKDEDRFFTNIID
ncbi:NucA/NucB deoxyribonuclease domain-containing protein [Amycolatopsis circi]|uniref:NucA/NucB deoxyribonuclease domain-containing protein n=1 Tax=Amycolatopsis circi TaxID=871959 RepID=UPI0013BEAB14|nr:hypothetical protein [Amycolatopsis circi]